MYEETEDPTTFIIDKTDSYTEYENIDGKKWRISGTCIACGLCENTPKEIPSEVVEENIKVLGDGSRKIWNRKLIWTSTPGMVGACLEESYQNRKDIPMTPDFVNETEGCTLEGIWINGN